MQMADVRNDLSGKILRDRSAELVVTNVKHNVQAKAQILWNGSRHLIEMNNKPFYSNATEGTAV